MSKRCELQKEYYQQYGNYKGNGKYKDEYVSWLEEQILALRIHSVGGPASESVSEGEQLGNEGSAKSVSDGCECDEHSSMDRNGCCRKCGGEINRV